jgi:hypothetical protein
VLAPYFLEGNYVDQIPLLPAVATTRDARICAGTKLTKQCRHGELPLGRARRLYDVFGSLVSRSIRPTVLINIISGKAEALMSR